MMDLKIVPRALLLAELAKYATGIPVSQGLADPAVQSLFTTPLHNPLDPGFIYNINAGEIRISVGEGVTKTGLVDENGNLLSTPIWGYGTYALGHTWPGRTFVVESDVPLRVKWVNNIPVENGYLLTGKNNGELGNFLGRSVVDTSYHWAYNMHGYEGYSIETHGTPIVPHLHGSHADDPFDGSPEYFFAPDWRVRGPGWSTKEYVYSNNQPAAMLWYHDHALGITRLNVHAGMAGLYIVRDEKDTGKPGNAYNLPVFPYEIPLVIQDRMFKENGELFYPAFPGDPYYKDFITDEGARMGTDDPSALAEFFGDFMVTNGKLWPKMSVEPRLYRLRLLNGCDSRFLVIQFVVVELQSVNPNGGTAVPFTVIGGDQGFATSTTTVDTLLVEPSSRYDIIFNFAGLEGKRVIVKNMGGDEPFGGDIPGPQVFQFTDRIVAFDVENAVVKSSVTGLFSSLTFDASAIAVPVRQRRVDRRRRVGLFEGHDQYGRLQPLLGTVDSAVDQNGKPIYWPDTEEYRNAGVVGQMFGTMTWHAPVTENPRLYDVEEWEIWNLSADAHPIHLHMVKFEIVGRQAILFDSNANAEGEMEFHDGMEPAGDGTYTYDIPLVQHDGSIGEGYAVGNPTYGEVIDLATLPEYVTNFPKDTVTALPGQITTIKMYFDKPGRFNWHCHILAHEDHEMMRVFHVGPLPKVGDDSYENTSDASSDASSTRSPQAVNGTVTEYDSESTDSTPSPRPTTRVPTTSAPVTRAPTTRAPTTRAPTTARPTRGQTLAPSRRPTAEPVKVDVSLPKQPEQGPGKGKKTVRGTGTFD